MTRHLISFDDSAMALLGDDEFLRVEMRRRTDAG
jgi:hypothetical protein